MTRQHHGSLDRIIVDYNNSSDQDGEYRVEVGLEDAWQLIGMDLLDGKMVLAVDPDELEMVGVLHSEQVSERKNWYVVVDQRTVRHFTAADLTAQLNRISLVAPSDYWYRDGLAVVFFDGVWEVYGTLVSAIDQSGQKYWEGIPDWATRRPRTELPPAAWAEHRRLVRENSDKSDSVPFIPPVPAE